MPMKNRVIFFFLLSMAIGLPASEHADAAALTMGQFQSIASDGSLDALRNPSLMTGQTATSSIGVIFLSNLYLNRLFSYSSITGSTYARPRFHDSKSMAGSMFLSYCGKTPRATVGIAIGADNPYQADYTRYSREYIGNNISTTASADYRITTGDIRKISPSLVISCGVIVSGNHSIGFQWALGYSRIREKSKSYILSGTIMTFAHRAVKRTENVSAEMSLGYSYRTPDSQAGLMIRSGRFNWEKTNIKFGHGDFTNSLIYPGRVSEPYYLQYDRGLSITAGGYHKLAPFIAVALEGEYEIPVHYNHKAVRYDETTVFYGMTTNLLIRKSGLYSISAGFEILPSGPVTISLGGKVSTTRERRKGMRLAESLNTDVYSGTLGLDIRVIDSLLVMVGSRLVYTHERTAVTAQYENVESIARDGRTRTLKVDLFLGLSGGF